MMPAPITPTLIAMCCPRLPSRPTARPIGGGGCWRGRASASSAVENRDGIPPRSPFSARRAETYHARMRRAGGSMRGPREDSTPWPMQTCRCPRPARRLEAAVDHQVAAAVHAAVQSAEDAEMDLRLAGLSPAVEPALRRHRDPDLGVPHAEPRLDADLRGVVDRGDLRPERGDAVPVRRRLPLRALRQAAPGHALQAHQPLAGAGTTRSSCSATRSSTTCSGPSPAPCRCGPPSRW